uniref:S-protein homolog n=1 Tax=Solanum tuberosum TaxID=4113 RepID=M1DPQ0_SOLTU
MDYSQFKTILLLCIFFFFCFPQAKGNHRWDKYTVVIYNALPFDSPKLTIHCHSADDDLGYHDLAANENFSWSFKFNKWLWARTKFSCEFWWSGKNKSFVVFNDFDHCILYSPIPTTNYCQWTTQEDGFWLSNYRGDNYRYTEW